MGKRTGVRLDSIREPEERDAMYFVGWINEHRRLSLLCSARTIDTWKTFRGAMRAALRVWNSPPSKRLGPKKAVVVVTQRPWGFYSITVIRAMEDEDLEMGDVFEREQPRFEWNQRWFLT